MIDFIVRNYYVILVICILLIFAIIGYIIDTLKSRKYEENNVPTDTYIPEEEIFIQKFETEVENTEENNNQENNVDDLLTEYNNVQKDENSI